MSDQLTALGIDGVEAESEEEERGVGVGALHLTLAPLVSVNFI